MTTRRGALGLIGLAIPGWVLAGRGKSQALAPIVLVASAIFGYLCGRMALKQESILGPVIFHMGFYLILLLPILF